MTLFELYKEACNTNNYKAFAEALEKAQEEVNVIGEDGKALLHKAAESANNNVIPYLLAHPLINVNLVDSKGWSALQMVCRNGNANVVENLLKHNGINVNQAIPDNTISDDAEFDGGNVTLGLINCSHWTPLHTACFFNRPGVVAMLMKDKRTDVRQCFEKLKSDPEMKQALYRLCNAAVAYGRIHWEDVPEEVRIMPMPVVSLFAAVVFLSDGLLRIPPNLPKDHVVARFFRMAEKLPMELQMLLCHRMFGSGKTNISIRDAEKAFRDLAKSLNAPLELPSPIPFAGGAKSARVSFECGAGTIYL